MKLAYLKTFIRVADRGSFSQAARELRYTQSAITIQIQQLEEEFHTQLFDRIGKGVRLTAHGQLLYNHAQSIMAACRQAEYDMEHAPIRDPIHLGTIHSLCNSFVQDVLMTFYRAHPDQSVRITTGSPWQIERMLNSNELDLAYLFDRPLYDVNWIKPVDEEEDLCFIAHRDNPLAEKDRIKLEDLMEENFLLTEKNDNYRFAFEQELAKRGLEIQARLEVPNTDIILRLIEENCGISFLPKYSLRHHKADGTLKILPVEDFHLSMNRQLIYHKKKWLSQPMKDMIRFFQEH
ncbi:LysR family transcriptional regulator [Kallipyga gabonensis]|uniref:LysR family transcriptional regulator n=1 Tax=Kallipyga gabonensis TaxID=1686287 RepID=UPI0006B4D0A1|nr:LysR family transcriptional regulator [Kallipyga gabonensis]